MLQPEQMEAAVHAYFDAFARQSPECVVALFAEDATVEDPVGGEALVGRSAFAPFFAHTVGSGAKLTLEGPVRTGPDYAAFAFAVRLAVEGVAMRIDVIDVFHFNAAGKVRHMQAFWGPRNFNPENQDNSHA